jgi:hypothetical protein
MRPGSGQNSESVSLPRACQVLVVFFGNRNAMQKLVSDRNEPDIHRLQVPLTTTQGGTITALYCSSTQHEACRFTSWPSARPAPARLLRDRHNHEAKAPLQICFWTARVLITAVPTH